MHNQVKTPFINLRTDFGFKLIFASAKNKHILIRFLNALLGKQIHVTDVKFRPTEQLPGHPQGKKIIYDVFFESNVSFSEVDIPDWIKRNYKVAKTHGYEVNDSSRHHFILEMQNINQPRSRNGSYTIAPGRSLIRQKPEPHICSIR